MSVDYKDLRSLYIFGEDDDVLTEDVGVDVDTDEDILDDSTEDDDEESQEDEEETTSSEDSEEEESEEEDEEDEEDKEDGEQKEDEEDETDDEMALLDRPTLKDLKQAYPDILKKFPTLRDALYREQAYTKLYPTVEDAQDAQAQLEVLTGLRDDLVQGKTETLFTALEGVDKSSTRRVAKDLLPSLYKYNKDLYTEAVTPLFENLVRNVFDTATRSKNEQLEEAALKLSEYLFDTEDVARGQKTTIKSDVPTEVDKERAAFERQRYEVFYGGVVTKINKSLTSIVTQRLGDDLPPFARKTITKQVMEDVTAKLEGDKNHMKLMQSRWRSAKLQQFDEGSKSRIINTFLARARQLVPPLVSRYQTEWLESVNARKSRNNGEEKRPTRHVTAKPQRAEKRKVDISNMSDLDILAS